MSEERIMVGCNILASVESIAYTNHCQSWYNWGKNLGSKYKFFFNAPRRQGIDMMRNKTAAMALELDCKWLFFYDDDVVMPLESLERLISHNKDIISGVTYIRSYPFEPMVFKYGSDPRSKHKVMTAYKDFLENADENGLVSCDALGFSCVLINCEVLKQVSKPWFVTGPHNTEDVYFCIKAAEELGVQPYVDIKVSTHHLVEKFGINAENRDSIIEYYQKFLGKSKEDIDRGDQYLEECQKRLDTILAAENQG